jgi:hypothetical protein
LVLAGLFANFLMLGPTLAVTMTFDFNRGMGPNFAFYQRNTTSVALDDTGGNLRLYSNGMTGYGVRGGEVQSNFTIHGDFDLTVNCYILQGLASNQQVEVHPYGMTVFYPIRSNEPGFGGNNYHVWVGNGQGVCHQRYYRHLEVKTGGGDGLRLFLG